MFQAGLRESAPPSFRRVREPVLAGFLVFAALVGFVTFRDYVFEDAYITYRYALNLAEGRGFVFNPGEPVLGTTTHLLALILGGLAILGLSPPTGGAVVFVVSLGLAGWLGHRLLLGAGLPSVGALFAIALAWGAGGVFRFFGMETPLYLALLLGATLAASRNRPVTTGLLLGALMLTRYDGVLAAAAILGCRLILERRIPWRSIAAGTAVVAPWLLFAWITFGSPLPNTLSAKSADVGAGAYLEEAVERQTSWLLPRWRFGLQPAPVREAIVALSLVVPALLGAPLLWRRSPWIVALVAFSALLWIAYTILRPPPGHSWHLLPATWCLLLAGFAVWADLLGRLSRVVSPRFSARAAGSALVAVGLVASVLLLPGRASAEAERARDAWIYASRIESYDLFAEWILRHEMADLSVYTLEPGYLTYRTGQRAIDGAGLVTPGIRFHGTPGERTPLLRVLAEYRPGLVVMERPLGRPGPEGAEYRPVLQSASGKMLLLRDDLWAERLPRLRRAWSEQRYYPREPRHTGPVDWDFEEGVPDIFRCRPWACPVWNGVTGSPALVTRPGLQGFQAAWTAPLRIDFDELRFRFAAEGGRALRAQVLVDGWLVFDLPGSAAPEPREVAVPLGPYRGRSAVLRVVDGNLSGGRLALDDVRSVEGGAPETGGEAISGSEFALVPPILYDDPARGALTDR